MKKLYILLPAVLCMLGFAACSNETADNTPEETTAARTETTVTTTVTTTTETTTVTTTTTPDYQIVKDMLLAPDPLTARPTSCTFTLTNNTEERQPYTSAYRIYNAETGQLLSLRSGAEDAEVKGKALGAGESTEIEADWTELYGPLEDGTYIFELELSREEIIEEAEEEESDSSKDDSEADSKSDSKDDSKADSKSDSKDDSKADSKSDSKEDSSKDESSEDEKEEPKEPVIIRMVAQAEFEINSDGFVPRLIVSPESIKPEGCVVTIKNSPDAARDYGMVYRLYDETDGKHTQLFRQLDTDAKVDKNYHMEPGESITLKYRWVDFYGYLLEGDYAIEVDLLTEGEHEAVPYRATFTITS